MSNLLDGAKQILAGVLVATFHAVGRIDQKIVALKAYSQLMGSDAAKALVSTDTLVTNYAASLVDALNGNKSAAIATAIQAAQALGINGDALIQRVTTQLTATANKEIENVEKNATVDLILESIIDPQIASSVKIAFDHLNTVIVNTTGVDIENKSGVD